MLTKRFFPLLISFFSFFQVASQPVVDSLLNIIKQHKWDTTSAKAQISLAEYYFGTGDYNGAIRNADTAYRLSRSLSYASGIMQANFQKAKALISKGDHDLAMKSCMEGLGFADKTGHERMRTLFHFQMGQIFEIQKNYESALSYYDKAFQIAKKNKYEEVIDAVLSNMGNIYSEQGDHSKALNYYNESLAIAIRKNDSVSIADSYVNIGNEFFLKVDLQEALNWYNKAVVIYEKYDIKNQLAICYFNIASILQEEKKFSEAIQICDKAISIAKEIDHKNSLAEGYLNLSNSYARTGNYEKAFQNLQLSKIYYDSLYNEDMIAQTTELQTKYESDKKEKENQILKQQNDLQDLNINRQKIISYSVSFGLILMFVLAYFIFRGYKEKQMANILLADQNYEILTQKNIIEDKNKIVEEKNKDIIDSINYAKRLQNAILKPEDQLTTCFDDGFILFKPKDIVSGDFYWFEKFDDLSLVAAADCTGHGVPGAFMSIIGCNLLSQSVNEYAITRPAAILNSVNSGLLKVLQQKKDDQSIKDGMDIALCVFDQDRMILEYAGAYNPLWLIRNEKLIEIKADKFPVGAFLGDNERKFSNHEIPVQKGDMIYIFSDGFADQFGGVHGKKFKYKSLQQLLLSNYTQPCHEQRKILDKTFTDWAGGLAQVDDVLVIGFRI